MNPLFLDQDLKPTFEKIAMPVKLSDNPENWQREIASEVFKQLPFLADFAVNVALDRVDPQRGYAFGSAEVSNITDSPIPDQPKESVQVPIIVKDRLMQPLDVMLDGKEAYPLNERRLREKLFRTDTFETSTRKPTDQGMVDQLYPPMRTNYGYGNSVSTGAGVGGFGKQASKNVRKQLDLVRSTHLLSGDSTSAAAKYVKEKSYARALGHLGGGRAAGGPHAAMAKRLLQHMTKSASLCEAISPTLSEKAFDWMLEKLAEPETRLLTQRNSPFNQALYKLASAEYTSTEKTAQALVQSIAPTVVQLTKLASGDFLVKWANANAFAPQQAQVPPDQAGAMAGADLSGMQPGQTMTVTTQRAQKQSLNEPDATLITEFGDYIVKDADTGDTYQGTVLPVVDFQMQPLPLFVFTDGAGHYATQDEIVGVRQEGPGGMALQPQAAPAPEAPPATDPAAQGAPPAAPAPDAGMPKMAGYRANGFAQGVGEAARSPLKALKDASGLGTWNMTNQGRAAGHLATGAAAAGGAYALGKHHGKQKRANAQPQGDGVFVFHPEGGGKPFCTQPLTIKSSGMDPSGSQSYMAEDVFGATMQLMLTPGLSAFEPLDEDGATFAIPDDMQWVPLQGQAVHLAKGDSVDAPAAAKGLGGEVDVKSTGAGEVSMDGMPLAKVARDQRWFLKTAEAVFLLCGMGLTQDEAHAVIKEAASRKSGLVKLAGLNTITPLSVVHEQATKKASALLKQFDYSFWSRDLVKEAAALEDSETADKVLAMNFINPENIGIFASYLPELDATSAKLAEMLLAARLGMNQVPEGAAERAMKNLEEVIAGLRALQQKQLI